MDRKTKSTNEVSLIEALLVNEGVTGLIITIKNPNFYGRGELEPIPNPLFVLPPKGATYTPGFMGSRRGGNFKSPIILRRG